MRNKILLDSNVLVRYFLRDNEKQLEVIHEAIENNDCYVLLNVVQEVIYVLEGSVYNIPRKEIKKSIQDSYDTFEYLQILDKALEEYVNKPKIDFIDCLLFAYHRALDIDILTFDKKLNKKMRPVFNKETLDAFAEAEDIKKHPEKYKAYTDTHEMIQDILSEDEE